jgi:hypothetical protein
MIPEQAFSLLHGLLKKECALHRDYLAVLAEERDAITHFNEEQILTLSAKREKLYVAMRDAHERRRELMREFPSGDDMRLSQFIVRYCRPSDARVLAPLVAELKALIKRSHVEGAEFNQIADFGLKIVGGTLSILWSATQDVTRSYSRKGKLREYYHPSGDRPGTERRV